MNLAAPISEIMSENVVTVTPEQKLVDLKHIYENPEFHHHIPVVSDHKLVGIVSLIDFMRAISNASLDDNEKVYQNLLVKDIMTTNPVTFTSDASIKSVAELFAKGEIHSAVISNNGGVDGIATTADLIQYCLK